MKKSVKKKGSKNPNLNRNLLIGVVIIILIFVVAFNFAGKDSDEEGLAQSPPKVIPEPPPKSEVAKPCKQVGDVCGGMNGKCCPTTSSGSNNKKNPSLICDPIFNVCVPNCDKDLPVTCGKSFAWCCAQNQKCDGTSSTGCKNACSKDEITCGPKICCDVSDGLDPDNLPDKICIFDPISKIYTCNKNEKLKCQEPNDPKCPFPGDYICKTVENNLCANNKINKCCNSNEICIENKNSRITCLPPGTACIKNGVVEGSCPINNKCCGKICCQPGESCYYPSGSPVCIGDGP